MMRILIRDWSGLTLPSAFRRCMRPDHCPGHLGSGPGVPAASYTIRAWLDGADGPWSQLSARNGVADDAAEDTLYQGVSPVMQGHDHGIMAQRDRLMLALQMRFSPPWWVAACEGGMLG
jgi:hypothetical protein